MGMVVSAEREMCLAKADAVFRVVQGTCLWRHTLVLQHEGPPAMHACYDLRLKHVHGMSGCSAQKLHLLAYAIACVVHVCMCARPRARANV